MGKEQVVDTTKRFIASCSEESIVSLYPQLCDFLHRVAGPKNAFLAGVESWNPRSMSERASADNIREILKGYLEYVEAGLGAQISPERQAQLDVVSDFLEMANSLLTTKDVHVAAPAVLIGATLEEFLRTWVDNAALPLGNRKPSLEAYSQVLREADLITKQDGKDITAWAGIRNHAAHGEWDLIGGKERVGLMLEGVNLFLRKHAG